VIARLLPALLATLPMVCTQAFAAPLLDDSGTAVPTQPPAQRIVTLSPHATELVIAAGAAARLVAAAGEAPGLPAQVSRLRTLGGIDREQLLALQPDLVIAWASGNRAGDLAWLEAQGMRVFRSEPRDLRGIAANLRAIGRLSGTRETAGQAAVQFEQAIQTACGELEPVPVYVAVWDRPAMSVGGQHWLNDVLRHAGMLNAYSEVERGVFAVEAEALAAKQGLRQVRLGPSEQRPLDLGRPGPRLGEAVRALCALRMPGALQR